MKLLFLGYAVGEQDAANLSGVSVAGNKMQLNILENLKKEVDELETITVYPLATFPHDKAIYVKKQKIDLGKGVKSLRISFFNIPILKQFFQIISVYRSALRYIRKNPDAVVLTFNMYPQVGVPAGWLKKKCGNKIVSFLADLPFDDNYARKGIGKFLRRKFDTQTKKSILLADQVIVLNRHAREIFAPETDYLVIDGGVNLDEYFSLQNIVKGEQKRKNIVYGGSLAEYSGVRELVDAMDLVEDKDIELDIYGDGTLREYIRSKESRCIHYCGKVSNRVMLENQREAWLLVNPRPIDDMIAQVTFPSKIFEYLMSGTPVLATRLNGFSEEYEGKLFLAENNSPEELARCINEINQMKQADLKKIAEDAKQFVQREKVWTKQVKRIVQFIFRDESYESFDC